jgi:hypothetical protein
MNKKIITVASCSLVLYALGVTSLVVNYQHKVASAKSAGYTVGRKDGYADGVSASMLKLTDLSNENQRLTDNYNGLVNDYNRLRVAAAATNLQAAQPITCNSSTYGINKQFSSTTCN